MVEDKAGCILAVRVRGSAGVRDEVENTLKSLGLRRVNMATILEDTPSTRGALRKVKDRIFWGEATGQVLTRLLKENMGLSEDEVKKRFGVTIQDLAGMLSSGKVKPQELKSRGFKTTFNLHPPKGGFKRSLKNHGRMGELGYRGGAFKQTIERMI
ncbi:MAG: uL30 family ribosomal protein [Candidatus Bathyarchaeia archaeon]